MYFADLTPYTYTEFEPNTLNIGWLSKEYAFPKGDVSNDIALLVKQYLRFPVNNYFFGMHECEFCPDAASSMSSTAEIRILTREGKAYASPRMIYHYIIVHRYLPPQEFIDAVLTGPPPSSTLYRELAKNFPWVDDLPPLN